MIVLPEPRTNIRLAAMIRTVLFCVPGVLSPTGRLVF